MEDNTRQSSTQQFEQNGELNQKENLEQNDSTHKVGAQQVEDNSPYTAPESAISASFLDAEEIVPASKGLRFVNFILDYIGTFILAILVGIIFTVIGPEALAWLDKLNDYVFGIILGLSYYIFFEAAFGRTPGKFITGTRVVNQKGGDAKFSQILGRSLCRFIPFEAFSFLSESGRGWHDSIPQTYVIKYR